MKKFYLTGACLSALFLAAACNQAPTTTVTTNTTANTAGANTANTNSAALNTNASTASTTIVEAREPNEYQATVTLKLDPTGEQSQQNALTLPPLAAQVARNGANKRMEFTMPNGEKVVYLDLADQRLLLLPNRKQYTEINRDAVGFEVRDIMMPGQLVQQANNLRGVERVGEEQFNGRPVVRYRYGAVTDTKSQAGQVQTQSYILVDKETGLPLRMEAVSQASNAANVQGTQVKGLHLVSEMNNIQTTAPADLFTVPNDYAKIPPEQVRSQVAGLFNAALAIVGQMMQNSPVVNPTNSPTGVPNTPAQNTPRP